MKKKGNTSSLLLSIGSILDLGGSSTPNRPITKSTSETLRSNFKVVGKNIKKAMASTEKTVKK